MKKIFALVLVVAIVLLVGASAAFAQGAPPRRCTSMRTTSMPCRRYPPRQTSIPPSSGQPVSFVTDVPESGGLTVGTATLVAVGALGTLLVARRVWVFRPNR